MNSSGMTALATASDSAITLLGPANSTSSNLVVIITDQVPSFLSLDGGLTWGYLPAASDSTHPMSLCLTGVRVGGSAIMLKRVPGGTNLTGVYAWAA